MRLDGDPDIPPTAPAPPPPPPPCPPPPPRALPALAPPPPGSASSSHCKFIESFSRHNCQSSETSSQRSARTYLEETALRRLRVGARPGIGGGEGGEHRPGRHSERARKSNVPELAALIGTLLCNSPLNGRQPAAALERRPRSIISFSIAVVVVEDLCPSGSRCGSRRLRLEVEGREASQ